MLPNQDSETRPTVTLSITREGYAAFAVHNVTAGVLRAAMSEAAEHVGAYSVRGLNQDIATEAVMMVALCLAPLDAKLNLDPANLCLSPCCWRPAVLPWRRGRAGMAAVRCSGCGQDFALVLAAVTTGTLCPCVAGVQ